MLFLILIVVRVVLSFVCVEVMGLMIFVGMVVCGSVLEFVIVGFFYDLDVFGDGLCWVLMFEDFVEFEDVE